MRKIAALSALAAGVLAGGVSPVLAQRVQDGEPDLSRSRCPVSAAALWADEAAKDTFDRKWANAPVLEGAAAQDVQSWSSRKGPFVVRGAKLAGRELTGLKLADVCFEQTDLSGADLSGADFDRVGFAVSDLSRAVLKGRFRNSAFVSTALDEADASGADWTGTTLRGGAFSGLNLSGATLRAFTLDCSDSLFMYGDRCLDFWIVTGEERTPGPVDARGADLTEATFVYWSGRWRLDGARVDRTRVAVENAADLRGATLAGPVLVEAAYVEGGRIALSPDEWRALESAWAAGDENAYRRPSFDCAAARSKVERLICDPGDYGRLASLDRSLADLWRLAARAGAATLAEQRAWLKRRNACGDGACLQKAYDERLEGLRLALAPSAVPAEGAEAVYAAGAPPVSEALKATPLFAKLAPAFLSGHGNVLYVKGLADGRIEAAGEGRWFNGHACSLGGPPARFDPKSGWFVGEDPENSQRTAAPLIRLYGDRAEVASDQPWFADCGARGSWGGELVRIPVRPDDLPAIRAGLIGEPQTSPTADR